MYDVFTYRTYNPSGDPWVCGPSCVYDVTETSCASECKEFYSSNETTKGVCSLITPCASRYG
jgi:hypothetical protein